MLLIKSNFEIEQNISVKKKFTFSTGSFIIGFMLTSKSKETAVSSLYSTIKKSKQLNRLQHAKSYDDLFAVQELEPSEIKIILNHDISLKNIAKVKETQSSKIQQHQQKMPPYTSRQSKQALSELLQESVKKQNLLIKRQLFDPFKYFGSTGQLSSIQESTRHHQSRLQAMFSESNSPFAGDRSASYRKKSPLNTKRKVNLDVQRISNGQLIAKLQKLNEHEMKMRQKSGSKHQLEDVQHTLKCQNDKQNHMMNFSNYGSASNLKYSQKPQHHYQNSKIYTKKSTQNQEDSSMISQKKMSSQAHGINRSKQVNCSPKSYVKQTKQKYQKMNLNSLQKVRLKLKLTSSKN